MSKCICYKNKTSDDRCIYKAISGLLVCKRHASAKTRRLWVDSSKQYISAIKIQTIWRGYVIRNWLRLSGTGVLCRTECHNDEDIVTFVEKDKQSPFEYFSFYENGKLWWFDIQTIIKWSIQNTHILNPYTKQPLSSETRERLRNIYHYRLRHGLQCISNKETKYTIEQSLKIRITRIIQQLEENGFEIGHLADRLFALNSSDCWYIINLFLNDSILLTKEHKDTQSRRHKYVYWIRDALTVLSYNFGHVHRMQRITFNTILAVLMDAVNSFPYCFAFFSALCRL